MLVRIVTETPPFWQILLSFGIGFATVVGLMWLASRIYRVGMLMYGKKATIPEVCVDKAAYRERERVKSKERRRL